MILHLVVRAAMTWLDISIVSAILWMLASQRFGHGEAPVPVRRPRL